LAAVVPKQCGRLAPALRIYRKVNHGYTVGVATKQGITMTRTLSYLSGLLGMFCFVGCQGVDARDVSPQHPPPPEPAGGFIDGFDGGGATLLAGEARCWSLAWSEDAWLALVQVGLNSGIVHTQWRSTLAPGVLDEVPRTVLRDGQHLLIPVVGAAPWGKWAAYDLTQERLIEGPQTEVVRAARSARAFHRMDAGAQIVEHDNAVDLAFQRAGITATGPANVTRLGSHPAGLLGAWHATDHLELLDATSLQSQRTVWLEDFDTWVNGLHGDGAHLFVLDDGRGEWWDHGQRIGVFDQATGANLANVFLPDQLDVNGTMEDVTSYGGLWCRGG
jgi:hypothetical protein